MNLMLDLHGGRDNWTFTEQDFINMFERIYNFHYVVYSSNDSYMYASIFCNCRKALFMHEERADDIPKVLEFFQRCKRVNEYFYWDAQTDKKQES
jgi:hypothetical protein